MIRGLLSGKQIYKQEIHKMYRKLIQDRFDYFLHYTDIYRTEENRYLREAKILKLQLPHILQDFRKEDLLAGDVIYDFIGFFPRYDGHSPFFFKEEQARKLLDESRSFLSRTDEIESAIHYWHEESDRHLMPSDRSEAFSSPVLAVPDLDKLLQLGLHHLYEEVAMKDQTDPFIQALLITLTTIEDAIDFYKYQLCCLIEKEPDNTYLRHIYAILSRIRYQNPTSFPEAIQLLWIYAAITGLTSYGRMDVYLGDFYVSDLQQGMIDEDTALSYIQDLYRRSVHTFRISGIHITLGGLGRRNPQNADQLAILFMKAATRQEKETAPRLILRCYEGMNSSVLDQALKEDLENSPVICCSDDTWIPSIQKAFQINLDDAMSYILIENEDCIPEAKSVEYPDFSLDLPELLEKVLSLDPDFPAHPEDLWNAFAAEISSSLAGIISLCENIRNHLSKEAGFLHLSLLTHDCTEKGKPLLEGGIRYLYSPVNITGIHSVSRRLASLTSGCESSAEDTDPFSQRIFDCLSEARLTMIRKTGPDSYRMISR